jgi:HD-GYP domain-containing protein (c-di-GMP phosphodiesterase class II)
LVTVITTAIYFLLFSFALNVFEIYTGGNLLLVSVGVAIISSLLLFPLREKTQEWIDRYFYRTKYDAGLMLERLSETTAALMEVEDIAAIILDEIMDTLKVVHISFFVKYPARDVYQLVSFRGASIEPFNEIGANHPIIRWFNQNHRVLPSRELFINPIFKSLWDVERQLIGNHNLELFVPLVAGQKLVGLFGIGLKHSGQPYTSDDLRILMTAANQTAIAVQNARLFDQLQETFVQTVVTLANAIDVRDTYTSDHSQHIANLAEETATFFGCSSDEIQEIYWGGLLHDIGKIGIPDAILLKPGPLDEDEWAVIRTHPDIGADLIETISQLANVSPIIRASHEFYDGNGYPRGLAGEDIPLGARIVAVVDAFSAMTDRRVYKDANSLADSIEELKRNAGTQFDPRVVQIFLQVIEGQKRKLTQITANRTITQ